MPSRLVRAAVPTLLFALPFAFALGAGASCSSGGTGGFPAISGAGGNGAAAAATGTTSQTSTSASSGTTPSTSTSGTGASTPDGGVSCTDGIQDGDETDIDCGGGSYMGSAPCPPCANSKKCGTLGTNCVSLVCSKGICEVPTCTDGVQNGNETDIDCGGTGYMGAAACPPCNPGQKCDVPSDCSGGNCQTTCQCPMNMQVVPVQGGGVYCIDAVEVTYAAYNSFYNANPNPSIQDAWCSWNLGWTPAGAWPYAATADDEPVRYVNWCQAAAYCKYNGRRLCGQIGGGSVAQASFIDIFKDQWYNACSAQGANCTGGTGCYPYGSTYEPTACNGAQVGLMGPDNYTNWLTCQGGETSLLDMSGNVSEWEDSCSATTGENDTCAIRGGSYLDGADNLRCDSDSMSMPITQPRNYVGNDVGFRCCLL